MITPLVKVVLQFGRILLLCFTQWLTDHPDSQNPGLDFYKNITIFINNEFSKNENYREIGLEEMVNFKTLITIFFLTTTNSYYFQTKNLNPSTTFKQLFNKTQEEIGFNCDESPRICDILNNLNNDAQRINYVKDFRVSEKLFLYQLYEDRRVIPRNLWLTDKAIDDLIYSTDPKRSLNYPTESTFYRFLINKNLDLENLGIPDFGVHRDEDLSSLNYSQGIFIDTYLNNENKYRGQVQNTKTKRVQIFKDPCMIWPSIPTDDTLHDLLIWYARPVKNAHLEFYPYTSQPFNVTNNIIYNNSQFSIGDRYFRMDEEDLRGGFMNNYNTVLLFGDFPNSIAQNLTKFKKCAETELFATCVDEYVKWYDICFYDKNDNKCDEIKNNLEKLGLYIIDGNSTDNSNKNTEIVIFSVIGSIFVVAVVFFIVMSIKNIKKTSINSDYENI